MTKSCPVALKRKHLHLLGKTKVMMDSSPYPFVWAFFSTMLFCVVISCYLFVWMLFDRVLSYVGVCFLPIFIFALPFYVKTTRPPPLVHLYLICYVVVLHCDFVWVCVAAHVCGCIFCFILLRCECVNVVDGAHVAMPINAQEAMARPSKKK